MSPALKHLGAFAIKKETVWGTKDVTSMDFGTFISEGITAIPSPVVSAGINTSRFLQKRQAGMKMVKGPFSFEVSPEDLIGTLLLQVLGTEATAVIGASEGGEHTFTPGDVLPPGFTALVDRDVEIKGYEGGRLSVLEFSNEAPDGLLIANCEATFEDESDESAQTPVYTAENEFIYHTATINVDGSLAEVRNFTTRFDGALIVDRPKIGSNLAQQQQPGVYAITGGFQIPFDNNTLVNKVIDHTAFSFDWEFTGTQIGSSGVNRSLKVTIANAFFDGTTPVIDSREGEILLGFSFQAIKLPGSDILTAVLKNSQVVAY